MTSQPTPQPAPGRYRLTMLPDPPDNEEDTQQQHRHVARADQVLRSYYLHTLGRDDVLVGGEGYLCQQASQARQSPHPDLVVALGVPIPPDIIADEANGYTIDEIGQPPDFVLEVASETTAGRDETVKRDQYARLQVTEYWRFDGSGKGFYRTPLSGDLLAYGEYAPLPVEQSPDGIWRGFSPALGLELHVDGRELQFWDPATQEYLPDLIGSLQRIAEERAARLDEAVRADNAEARADSAEARAAQLEAEIRRLREGQ